LEESVQSVANPHAVVADRKNEEDEDGFHNLIRHDATPAELLGQGRRAMRINVATARENIGLEVPIELDIPWPVKVDNMESFLEALSKVEIGLLRLGIKPKLELENESKAAIDAGGVLRSYLDQIGKAEFLKKFFWQNDKTQEWYLLPDWLMIPNEDPMRKQLHGLGRAIGLCFQLGIPFTASIALPFWKALIHGRLGLEDYLLLDEDDYQMLRRLCVAGTDVSSLSLYFSIRSPATGKDIELTEGGCSKLVNEFTLTDFIKRRVRARLGENCGLNELASGFREVVEKSVGNDPLRFFTPVTLSAAMVPPPNVEVGDLLQQVQVTAIAGVSNLSELDDFFKNVLLAMNSADLMLLLTFWTGYRYIPVGGFSAETGGKPRVIFESLGANPNRLPSAHTCDRLRILQMPAYKTQAIMQQKLLQAIRETATGDFAFE